MNIQDYIRESVEYDIQEDNFIVTHAVTDGHETYGITHDLGQTSTVSEELRKTATVLLTVKLMEDGIEESDLKELPEANNIH